MKQLKYFSVILLAVVISACCSCKEAGQDKQNNIITGEIYITGNDPFTKVALRLDDETSYLISADEETLEMLRGKQGVIFDIKYKEIKKTPEGKIIVVEKIITKKK